MASKQLPTVDLSPCYISDTDEVVKQLHEAFRDFGGAYLTNHGIPQEQITDTFQKSETFFLLPTEIKRKHSPPKDSLHYGWFGMMEETLSENNVGDLKEVYNWVPRHNTVSPGDDVPGFKETLMALYRSSYLLCSTVLKLAAKGLGLKDHNAMTQFCNCDTRASVVTLRAAYYPPITEDSGRKPGQLRCGDHCDQTTVSLLFQDDVGGLEVLAKSGEYIPVPPVEGTVVCLVGDVLERWSSDRLRSARHKVVDPPSGDITTKRQSLVYFLTPDNDCIIRCLDGSNLYEPVTFMQFFAQQKYNTTDYES